MKSSDTVGRFARFDISRVERALLKHPELQDKECIAAIDKHAVERNLAVAQNVAESNDLCFVVKSDALGHGIANIVPIIRESARCYGITSNDDARAVRKIDPTKPLLRLIEPSTLITSQATGQKFHILTEGCDGTRPRLKGIWTLP